MKRLLLSFIALLFSITSICQTLWSNDFSNCVDWETGNAFEDGFSQYTPNVNFECGNITPNGLVAISTISSTTADNGYMIVDSEIYGGGQGGTEVENCWFQNAFPIELNGNDDICLTFETYYRMWDGGASDGNEYCLVEVSTDGVTWPDLNTFDVSQAAPGTRYELWPTMDTHDPVNNPTNIFFNLTTIASQPGVDQIWLRFRWKGTYGYAWMVDDVEVKVLPENNLTLQDCFVGDIINSFEYHAIPLSEAIAAPVRMGASVVNNGSLDQNAQITINIDNNEYLIQGLVAAGASDTLWSEEFFLPANAQFYQVVFSLAEDEILQDNFKIESIEVTTSSFGQNSDNGFELKTLNNDAETAIGCRYNINSATTCFGAEFLVGDPSDVGTLCQVFLYEEVDGVQTNTYAGQSLPFAVTQEMIDAGVQGLYTFIPLVEPSNLMSGSNYFIEIRRFESTDRIYILSNPEDSDFGMVGFGPYGVGGVTNWFVGFGFTPAIRLRLEEFGCSDLLACNYGADAICEYPEISYLNCDGECNNDINNNDICDEFEIFGCTDQNACNYNATADAEDGSCLYDVDVTAIAFLDANTNGIRDSSPTLEIALANIGHIYIEELDLQVFPNDTGLFVIQALPLGSYSVELVLQDGSNFLPTESLTNTITIPSCDRIYFPLFMSAEVSSALSGDNMQGEPTMACIEGFFPATWINNTGTQPLNGTVTMTFDPVLGIGQPDSGAPIISATPGVITWEISNLLPGQTINASVYIEGPGVDFVGDIFNFQTEVILNNNGVIVFEDSFDANVLVSCAYDPNDIQANPAGYTENHFILSDTEIEYKIRFQNTGNAPATDVTIENQIDTERLDITTFQPITSSHNMSTVVDADGMVHFIFNHIMLPDSTSDLEGSQGFLIYKIRTIPTVEVGEIINNTAAIYFDNNPPIITNTAFHEIYNCDEIPQFDEQLTLCSNDEFSQVITYPHIETITWLVNDQLAGNALSFQEVADFGESWNIEMIIENPLCQVSSQWTIDELPLPSNLVIEGIQGQLTAETGVAWQWYNADGTIIAGATEQTFGSSIAGDYYVVITGENGCTSQSEIFTIVSVDEFDSNSIIAFPNPVFDNLQLQVSQALIGSDYLVLDVTGREVMRGKITSINSIIDFSAQSSGSYIIKVGNANVRVQK
jgi:uncharacterized repeat protein (TIGR01451 family)